MTFIADNQTLDELNITGKYKRDSIFNLFNDTHTSGGEEMLEDMFLHPLTEATEINRRSTIFSYFQQREISFPFEKQLLDNVEAYTTRPCSSSKLSVSMHIYRLQLLYILVHDKKLENIRTGCLQMIRFLKKLKQTLLEIQDLDDIATYTQMLDNIWHTLNIQNLSDPNTLILKQLIRYDYVFRYTHIEEVKKLIKLAYLLDVYMTVGKIAKEKQLSAAVAIPKSESDNRISIKHLFHPLLEQAIPNSVELNTQQNVFFLTGANMAGKSTLIKAIGISIYLAHMGFPVPAKEMEFTIQDGIYTSINAPDNLSEGYSHFYAEVLRIKKIAGEVCPTRHLVVLLDELYKGTNVKDAYDATVAVTEAFASVSACFYVVSSHITEAGTTLQERCSSIKFSYLPSTLEGSLLRYSHHLQPGITNDCHGMMIIRNEHIMEILNHPSL